MKPAMPTRNEAWALLCEYTGNENLRRHALAVEACTAHYARKLNQDEQLWSLAGLLHDFDYERWPNAEHHPRQGHPYAGAGILREKGYPEEMIHAILGHAEYTGVARETALDHALFACDEMAGFLTACALVRPGKTIYEVEPASVQKRMKDKAFARGVNREDLVKGAAELNLSLEEHIANCIEAMRGIAGQLGLERKSRP